MARGVGFARRTLTCPGTLPIYVRAQGSERRVGHFNPGAEVVLKRGQAGASSEAVFDVDLGDSDLTPYVHSVDTMACTAR